MLSMLLPAPLIGALMVLMQVLLVLIFGGAILPFALLKFLIPIHFWRRFCSHLCVAIAWHWVATNRVLTRLLIVPYASVDWRSQLDPNKSYLLISNHQSWADILVMFDLFHGRSPFPRFFLKQELIWVPLIGLACWGMDFPFMRRHSREAIARNPELRNRDLETTRRACEVYRSEPVTVVNFLEGTRYTEAKRLAKQSPFRHLLRPKSAGLSFTLNAMGEQFGGIIDVTIAYPQTRPDQKLAWSWACGEQAQLALQVDLLEIPAGLMHGDYDSDADFRARFQEWVNGIWARKDARLDALLSQHAVGASRAAHS